MMNPKHFRELVLRPVLDALAEAPKKTAIPFSVEAEDLLFMIAAHESKLGTYLTQRGGGPARGIFQIEVRTLTDLYETYLEFRPQRLALVESFLAPRFGFMENLRANLLYQTAVARMILRRKPAAFPKAVAFDAGRRDPAYVWALATYAKKYWNGPGEASPEEYRDDYIRAGGLKCLSH